MQVEFDDRQLQELYTNAQATAGLSEAVIKRFRFVMGLIVGAFDERDFRAFPGLRFEKLKGKRAHQHSLRLNDQWRLIIEIRGKGSQKRIGIIEIGDYH